MPSPLLDPALRKPAPAGHPLHALLRERWSPRAFSPEPLPQALLNQLLEAARWAPSAFNEQPWRLVLARRGHDEAHARLLACLSPGNQAWAGQAAVLVVAAVATQLSGKAQPNRTAVYDLGQAVAHLSVQATALGLAVHQMAGLDLDAARQACALPDGVEPVVAIAIGHPADSATLPEPLRAKDAAPRVRKPLAEVAFIGRLDQPWVA